MNTYVKEYTSFMTDIRHKSLNTVESYKRDVTQYISYLDGTGVTDISSTTKTTVMSYLLYLVTINLVDVALSSKGGQSKLDCFKDTCVTSFVLFVYDAKRCCKVKSDF